MIRRDHSELSLSRQCRLLAISRSSLYHAPQGESAQNLELMRRIDELFLKYPFYGSRQMVRHFVAGRHLCGSSPGSASDAVDGATGHLPGVADHTRRLRHPEGHCQVAQLP